MGERERERANTIEISMIRRVKTKTKKMINYLVNKNQIYQCHLNKLRKINEVCNN